MGLDSLFATFLQAGFECSTHHLRSGKRLDLIRSTEHDRLIRADYQALRKLGISTVREGIRWHLIESTRGQYDFASVVDMLNAGLETHTEQIFDLFHFGWPDHLDVFSSDFVSSFAELAFRWAGLLRSRGIQRPFIAPCNEISFFAWAGGDADYLNPFQQGRGYELKLQMVRAGLAASQALMAELPGVRLVWPDPVIHIVGDPDTEGDEAEAERYRLSMFESWDMISGRLRPELGGKPEYLQIVGVNFYDRNEWMNFGRTLKCTDVEYKPFSQILLEVWQRYRVPLFVSETGAEDEKRPGWFACVAEQVRIAMSLGVPVEGLCLYPILNHPGWEDDRHCYNGLFDYAKPDGSRDMYKPLAAEIARQGHLFDEFDKEQERHE